jgi:hypothetical protein
MDNRIERIGALRKYMALLRQEEDRLARVKASPNLSDHERVEVDDRLRVTEQKIADADKELRGVEGPGSGI